MELIRQRYTIFSVAAVFVIISFMNAGDASSVQCQPKSFAEVGKSFELPCQVLGSNYDLYWYKGLTADTAPLLSLVDGISGGSEYQKRDFELTINGSLRIINSQLQHEGSYTLRVYFSNFEQDTSTTKLLIYIQPDPPCPLTDACGSTCTGCQLNVTTSGSLTCYVNGSRPMMDVDWIVTNQSGVSFTKEEQTHKEMGDKWYTEKTIEYTTPDCGADATFRCIASLPDFPFAPLLDTYYSTVRMNKACKETLIPKVQVTWPLVVVGIVVVLVILVFIACCLYRRKGTNTQIAIPNPNLEMQTTKTKSKPKPKKKKNSLEERKNTLVEGLVKYYEKFGFIKPIPWGEPIPTQAFYTTCQCTVTNANGDVSHHDSDFLTTPEFNCDSNRVFIIADLGYGKTTFTQHLVSDWVSKMEPPKTGRKDKIREPILIYVHLKEVDPSMILSDLVEKMMPDGIDIMDDDIVEIFMNFEFQVLLDGLNELSMSTNSANTSAENLINDKEERVNLLSKEVENDSKLTVANLLDNKINTFKFKKIKVWVTSREVDDMKASFALPYSKVKLNGFSDPKVNEYIKKTCKYYFKPQNKNEERKDEKIDLNRSFTKDAKNEANDIITEDEVSDELTTKLNPGNRYEIKQGESQQKDSIVPGNDVQTPEACDTLEKLSKKVTQCIELNNILKIFSETPLLLTMIVHIITCRMLDPSGIYEEVNVNKLTTIIKLVITCLESRYVQKVNNQSIEKDIKSLKACLGKIAFENKVDKREYWNNNLGKKDTELALAVGLLKYSKQVGSGVSQLEELAFSSYAGIMFYHEFFQDFLAAQYVLEKYKECAVIDEFITKESDNANVRLLQFLFDMNHARLDKAVEALIKDQTKLNRLIYRLYEIIDIEKKQSIFNDMIKKACEPGGTMVISIHDLNRKHHKFALKEFCDACNTSDLKLGQLTFREECAIDFMRETTMPSLRILIFLDMTINENQFVSIITSLTNQKCPEILQFVKCSVPEELKGEAKQTVESALNGLGMKIYNCKETPPVTNSVPTFNPKNGNWKMEMFPNFQCN